MKKRSLSASDVDVPPTSLIETHTFQGVTTHDRYFVVPLDYSKPNENFIKIFARHVLPPKGDSATLPWLVYFQGGPGFESPRPITNSGWLKTALESYQVLLLDQRGTGLSTALNYETLSRSSQPESQTPTKSPSSDSNPAQQMADLAKFFRADSIVRDAEEIRKILIGNSDNPKWSILGQSFGGFCAITYLSFFPDSLSAVFMCGGLAPLLTNPDDVYEPLFKRVITQNNRYYARYPEDITRARKIATYLKNNKVELPNGGILTLKRFQQLGMSTLGTGTGFERLHYLLVEAFETPILPFPRKKQKSDNFEGEKLGYKFLSQVQALQGCDTNPIYALLHESIYCQQEKSNWSAERIFQKFSEFDAMKSLQNENMPIYFFGEAIYKDMFDDYVQLRPLKETAEILAQYENWPKLYDLDQLKKNTVPVFAASYYDDIYVDLTLSTKTAEAIKGCQIWITNEYAHSGLHDDTRVLQRLFSMYHGET